MMEIIANKLQERGRFVILTSAVQAKFLRLLDMSTTIFKQRRNYQIAHIDVFSGYAFIWAFLCGWLLQRLNKPFVVSLRGGDLPDLSRKHFRLVKYLLSNADTVISPSFYLADKLSNIREDIQVIPNGVDISSYPNHIRNSPEPKLIWLRAFHEIYNPTLAPQIVSILKKEGIEVQLKMVGPSRGDGTLQAVKREITVLNVDKYIEIIPGVEKTAVPDALSFGDIFINTTNVDNTPVSVIEAMACGLCIVSTNVGGIPYLIDDGVDGLLVPPDNAEAMAEAVKKILNNPELAQKLSANARKKTEQFDWERIIPMWEEVFQA